VLALDAPLARGHPLRLEVADQGLEGREVDPGRLAVLDASRWSANDSRRVLSASGACVEVTVAIRSLLQFVAQCSGVLTEAANPNLVHPRNSCVN
jgi:hypothetical protein